MVGSPCPWRERRLSVAACESDVGLPTRGQPSICRRPAPRSGIPTVDVTERAPFHYSDRRENRCLERLSWCCSGVAAVAEVIEAFGRGEPVAGLAEEGPQRVDRAPTRGTHQTLELGEGVLDRVQVRAIGRQEHHPRPHRFNPPTCLHTLVAGQVVEYHDV